MASIIFLTQFIANASKLCGDDGGLSIAAGGTWREKKLDVTIDSDDNDDDGYSKSNGSSNSTHETLTTESGISASSTSGVSSCRQSENGSGSGGGDCRNSHTGHNHEIVNKILCSREINDAIFKPGKIVFFDFDKKSKPFILNCITDFVFRLSIVIQMQWTTKVLASTGSSGY